MSIRLDQVLKHNSPTDLWLAINGKVYDVTKFQHEHPGGPEALQKWAGADASQGFGRIVDHEDNDDVVRAMAKCYQGNLVVPPKSLSKVEARAIRAERVKSDDNTFFIMALFVFALLIACFFYYR